MSSHCKPLMILTLSLFLHSFYFLSILIFHVIICLHLLSIHTHIFHEFSDLSVTIMSTCLIACVCFSLRCDRASVTIHSAVSKTALKEQQEQQGNQKSKPKDIAKFSLYTDFSCNVQQIQHHQVWSQLWSQTTFCLATCQN